MAFESKSSPRTSSKQAFPSSIRTRRATVACTRCRLHRSKCKHDGAHPPCIGCREAGAEVAKTCKFIGRGGNEPLEKGSPSQYSTSHPSTPESTLPILTTAEDRALQGLPPREEIIAACRVFINCCFQLHFIPKLRFLAQVEDDFNSINQFLLMSILAMSARFTPALIDRFGGPAQAADIFAAKAEQMASTEMYKPTLETAQGFILLGAAEWANGDCNKALIHLGVAATIVGMLRLHREDSYILSENAAPEDVMYSEAARRTLWMMGLLRNLFAGHHSPVPFALKDLTALLPCEEAEFAFGIVPKSRTALPTSQAAIDNPELINHQSRPLFATVIQAYKYWGQVARDACLEGGKLRNDNANLWDTSSQDSQISMTLLEWEASLSKEHSWSDWNLRVYKSENLDIAYTSIFLAMRLSNIVLRRTYLKDIKAAVLGKHSPRLQSYLENMALELFSNVISLHEGVKLYLVTRPLVDGFPPLLPFSIYLCGSLAMHLSKCPQMCPQLAHRADGILSWSKGQLLATCEAWPIAAHWHRALEMASGELSRSSQENISVPEQPNPASADWANIDTANDVNRHRLHHRSPMFSLTTQLAPRENVLSTEPLGFPFDYYTQSDCSLLNGWDC